MPHIFEYHRSRLNKRCNCVYEDIFQAVKNRQKTLEISGLNYPDISKCYDAVFSDHSELFWMSHQCTAETSTSFRGMLSTIFFEYIYSEMDCLSIKEKATNIAKRVRGKSDEETENNIVEHIVRNTIYEIDNNYNQNMASALYFGKAQCSGISKAVKYLCDCNDIRCIFVDGSITASGGGPHAWNMVEINGNFYHLDVTTILASNPVGTKALFKPCFNWTDSQLSLSHTWNKKNFPVCDLTFKSTVQKIQSNTINNLCHDAPARQSVQLISQNTDGIIKLSTLVQLRTFVEEQYIARNKDISFMLTLEVSPEERMKLITNAVKMVMGKLRVVGCFVVEIIGDINTVKFK